MADTTTAYGMTKVEVGASNNTWGGKLNANMDTIQALLDGTNAIAPSITGSAPVRPLAGTAAAPAFSFSTDTNTGLYSIGADQIGASTGGTLRLTLSTTALTSTLPIYGQDGSAASPAYTFATDTNTGIYRASENNIGFSANGAVRLVVSDTAVTASVPVYTPVGTTSAPSIAFSGDTNTGISFLDSDRLVFVNAGVESARFNAGGTFMVGQAGLTNPGVGGTTAGASITNTGQLHGSVDGNYAGAFNRNTSDGTLVTLRRDGNQVGSISVTATTTTYNTSSWRALKENIDDLEIDPGAAIDALKPRSFNWKQDGSRAHGFIADEFGEVFPNSTLVTDSGIASQISPSSPEVIAVLVAEIQSLRRRLSALEGR